MLLFLMHILKGFTEAGKTFDWELASRAKSLENYFTGGLDRENIKEGIEK